MVKLCAPALSYIAFSLTQVVIDTFKGLYNTAFFKFIVMIIITFLLNALCQSGMSIISWIIVFIPFIFMSVIVTILLYVFGLDAATGTLNFKCDTCDETSEQTGNLIYSSETYKKKNLKHNPVKTNSVKHNPVKHNLVKQKQKQKHNNYVDTSYAETPAEETNNYSFAPGGSSDPQYESFLI